MFDAGQWSLGLVLIWFNGLKGNRADFQDQPDEKVLEIRGQHLHSVPLFRPDLAGLAENAGSIASKNRAHADRPRHLLRLPRHFQEQHARGQVQPLFTW